MVLPILCVASQAAQVTFPDLAAVVPGKPGLTYLDLARQVAPDLAPYENGYQGHKVMELRHIGGSDMEGFPPENFYLHDVAALAVRSGGHDRLALLLDVGNDSDIPDGFAILALFDLSGEARLIDAANIAYDRSNYFRDPTTMAVADGTDVIATMSIHFNSSQSYIVTPVILIRNDRLELVDAITTFDDAHCNYTRNQTLDLKPVPAKDNAFAAIAATVTEIVKPSDQTCEDEDTAAAATRTFTVNYNWNAAASRYEPDSDAFEKLRAENEERY